ncbi:MAG TPA: spermidine/putrescine ABC transporter substrate-binding protein [Candidatus Nanopelagicaceae bacterium]|nr:spermidine/putrescine ABC transporter substrate-binding protein [Candidatus Nanopelagicaceae bacterium]
MTQIPESVPGLAQFIKAQATRRAVLGGAGAVGIAAFLAACGTSAGTKTGSAAGATVTDLSATDKTLIVSNWPLYIDVDSKNQSDHPTIDAFTAKTGIKVTYTEDVSDNNVFFGKIRNQLAAGQPIGRDLIVMTDWMAARLIRLGWVEKVDHANTPNVEANLAAALKSPPWDPNRDYSAPWQSGFSLIAYNEHVTTPVKDIDELFTRPDLKGKVTLLTEMRDTVGLVLLSMGKDPANFTDADFNAAMAKIQAAVDSGQVRKFTGNEYAPDLAKGNIAACIAWSGDVVQLQFADPKINYTIPDAGVTLWSDNMLIPNKASHKANAEAWMNYYYDPAVAAQVAAYVNYICPVEGAKAEAAKIDPALASNQLIFPSAATLAKSHIFMGLDAATESKYQDAFSKVSGG